MDGEYLGFCMVHSGASHGRTHHKKRFLEPRKGKPEKTTTPKRDLNHSHRCTYTHAKTHPHNRLHTKCAFWIKCGTKNTHLWHSTQAGKTLIGRFFFLSFLFLNGAFSCQHVIGLEVKQVILFSVVFWRWQWRVVVWGTQRNTQKEIKDTEVLHRDSVRHLFSNPSRPREWHFQVQNAGVVRSETACWHLRSALLCGTSLCQAKR